MTERRGIPTTGFEAPPYSADSRQEKSSNKTLPGIGGWQEGAARPEELTGISDAEIEASIEALDDDEPEITYHKAA
jgi:hypothetical protein